MDDLIERLRDLGLRSADKAADEIELLRAGLEASGNVNQYLASRNQTLSLEATRLRAALKPFADCCDQIADDEDDEEWAKFRLLIKDYRAARAAMGSDMGKGGGE